jgi:hypothetical protein
LTLLHQNADLKDRVRSLETERAALDAYELHAFHPGQYAYRPKASSLQAATRHYACANCYSAGRISILSARWDQEFQQTHVMCPACKTDSWVDGHGPVD